MSNAEKMVMVPRELAELSAQALSNSGYDLQARVMEDAIAQQHQGEPVSWRVGSQIFQQEHLARMHSGGVNKPVEPLYTHADPGEVERLRDELEIVKNNDLKWRGLREQEAEIENLRAQLAERDALLPTLDQGQKDALYSFYLSICCGDQHSVDKPLIRQLCEFGALESVGFGKHRLTKFGEFLLGRMSAAALSASAEPSAPKCGNCGASSGQACNDKGCGYLETGNGEPSAPVEVDERADFEAAYSEHEAKHTGAASDLMAMRRGEEYRVGYNYLNGAWFGWQARAALERK